MRFLPKQSKQVDSAPFMNGVRVATLALGMMLLAPHGASAQSSFMCADQSRDAVDASEHQGVESLDELEAARLVVAPPVESDDLPWCTNRNDPQCSKRSPASSAPSLLSIGASPLFALSVPLTLPSPFSIECDFAEYSCGGPRDAMRSKLERPPE
jgi:hypothetical protein